MKNVFGVSLLIVALTPIAINSYQKFSAPLQNGPEIQQTNQNSQTTTSDSTSSNITEEIKIPYPKNYKEFTISETSTGKQITMKTKQTSDEIQRYYRNILTENDWQITAETNSSILQNLKYKKDETTISITTVKQTTTEYTLITIDILETTV
jgi:hypothetical protein